MQFRLTTDPIPVHKKKVDTYSPKLIADLITGASLLLLNRQVFTIDLDNQYSHYWLS